MHELMKEQKQVVVKAKNYGMILERKLKLMKNVENVDSYNWCARKSDCAELDNMNCEVG
jgi:hypothetical protein